MKKLKWIVIGVVVLVVLVVGGIWMNINGIVRSVVEAQASDSLNLQTTLGGANVSLLGGSFGLSDLQIASPKGFSAPHMFTLGGIHVGVSLGKLRSDPITIDQIEIDEPRLVIERVGDKFNFQVLMDQPSAKPVDTSKPPTDTRAEGEPIRLIIHDLTINNAHVLLHPSIPGMAKEIDVDVPSVQLQDIGKGEGNQNGAAIKDVMMKVITALAQKAAESDRLPGDVKQLLSMNVDQVRDQMRGKLNERIQDATKDLGKNLSPNAGKAIQNGIGNLLNRGDKSDNQK